MPRFRWSPARRPSTALVVALALHVASAGWMAWTAPIGPYFYDERFSLENVRRAFVVGDPIPRSYFWYAPIAHVPQSATLLALDRIGSGLGIERLAVWDAVEEQPTQLGIRIARAFGILYGCLTLVVVHRLGALVGGALDGRLVADLGVLVLAGSPWFARGSAGFKPDPLLLLATMACFVPLLRWVEERRPRQLLAAAALVGVAAAAKVNGAVAAVPVAIACWLDGTWRERLRRSATTAAVAIVTYLALNPWLQRTLYYLRRVDHQYAERSLELGYFGMIGTLAARLAEPYVLGAVFAAAAAAGVVVAAVVSRERHGGDAVQRRRLLLWLAYPAATLAVLAAGSRYPKINHLLQVLPFAAVVAGLAFAALARRLPGARAAGAVTLVVGALAVTTLARFHVEEAIPPPTEQLHRALVGGLGDAQGRVVAWFGDGERALEAAEGPWRVTRPLLVVTDADPTAEMLDRGRFDCVAGDREVGATARAELERRFGLTRVEEPRAWLRLLRRSGGLWYGCAPWSRAAAPVWVELEPAEDGALVGRLPAPAPAHDALSIAGFLSAADEPARLALDGSPIAIEGTARSRVRGLAFSSERLPPRPGGESMRVEPGDYRRARVAVHYWLAPANAVP